MNTKATEIENKVPDITDLATKAVLNTRTTEIENNIPDTSSVITTPEFNRLTKKSFDVRIKEAAKNLASEIR